MYGCSADERSLQASAVSGLLWRISFLRLAIERVFE